MKHEHFSLEHFEGSIEFLICLIHKQEMEISEVSIQQLIHQFILYLNEYQQKLENGAKFIAIAAHLVLLKSQFLLPISQKRSENLELIEDPHFDIIHHLVDYCRFKQAAKELHLLYQHQQAHYFRGIYAPKCKKPLGIEHISLDELSTLFKKMIKKGEQNKNQIQKENWRVSDKISVIRYMLKKHSQVLFKTLFLSQQLRLEMIVIFLATLELMKIGEIRVVNQDSSIWIFAQEKYVSRN